MALSLVFVAMAARGSSRDELPAAHPADSASAEPSLTPNPSVPRTGKPTSTGQGGHSAHKRHNGSRQPACQPTRLVIAKIHVDTPVLALGEDSVGAPLVPSNPTEVSWFNRGVVPGKSGNAAIQGHTWSGGNGVFDNLGKVTRGDRVVVMGNGCRLTFIVDHIQRHVPPNLRPSDVRRIYRTHGKPGVTLVTCGDFDGAEYHSRIVVHAHLSK